VRALQPDLYELLDVSPEAPPERIDAAIDVAAADARVLQYATDPQLAAEARHTLATLDHARRILLDPYARRSYDLWRSGIEPSPTTNHAPVMFPQGGTRTAPPSVQVVPVPARSKVVAALLAFFLGWLGAHNFYLGRNGVGVAQLSATVVSCGLFSPAVAVWAFVEGVLILTGGIKDSLGRPLV
jgi:TM2 domain-containing membrane protein YozV